MGALISDHNHRLVDISRYYIITTIFYFTRINAHGLKIQGRGYLIFFAKIPRGVKVFRKNCLGGLPI